jgi:hypothetical protein
MTNKFDKNRTFDQAIQDALVTKPKGIADFFATAKKAYFAQWSEQTSNFAALHIFIGVLLGAIWFAIFVLPPAF